MRLCKMTMAACNSRAGYKDTAGMIRQATKTRAIQKRLTTLIYFLSQELKSISEDSTKFALAKAQGLIKCHIGRHGSTQWDASEQ